MIAVSLPEGNDVVHLLLKKSADVNMKSEYTLKSNLLMD